MKINCEYCQEDLKSKTREPFDKLTVGRVICPHCNKENKRYISEFDLLLFMPFASLLYAIGVVTIMYILEFLFSKNTVLSVVLLVLILAIGYIVIDQLAKYIYLKAPYKSAWKNQQLAEDNKVVSRRLNYQLTLFFIISALIGIHREMLGIYIMLASAIIIFSIIKAYLAYKIEVKQINKP